METHDARLLQAWLSEWRDIVDFECIPVVTSAEAARTIAPQL
jgi:hypothetical protein